MPLSPGTKLGREVAIKMLPEEFAHGKERLGPSRSEAGEHPDRARWKAQDSRLRSRPSFGNRRSHLTANGVIDRRVVHGQRSHSRNRTLHEPGTGAREGGGQANRCVGVRVLRAPSLEIVPDQARGGGVRGQGLGALPEHRAFDPRGSMRAGGLRRVQWGPSRESGFRSGPKAKLTSSPQHKSEEIKALTGEDLTLFLETTLQKEWLPELNSRKMPDDATFVAPSRSVRIDMDSRLP